MSFDEDKNANLITCLFIKEVNNYPRVFFWTPEPEGRCGQSLRRTEFFFAKFASVFPRMLSFGGKMLDFPIILTFSGKISKLLHKLNCKLHFWLLLFNLVAFSPSIFQKYLQKAPFFSRKCVSVFFGLSFFQAQFFSNVQKKSLN